jgi:hypothetical protein
MKVSARGVEGNACSRLSTRTGIEVRKKRVKRENNSISKFCSAARFDIMEQTVGLVCPKDMWKSSEPDLYGAEVKV